MISFILVPVTPSRVCELKFFRRQITAQYHLSHPHGCVSWNFCCFSINKTLRQSHPHGCVSWNIVICYILLLCNVTPSRVCELKWHVSGVHTACKGHTLTGVWVEMSETHLLRIQRPSHPHGCVSWNVKIHIKIERHFLSHPHGCVSWNPCFQSRILHMPPVTPSRVCELK